MSVSVGVDLMDALWGRRSIRRFTDRAVTDEDVENVLRAAQMAPSAGNLQAYDFVVIRDQGTRDRLADAALGQRFVAEAPVAIVVGANRRRSSERYGPRGDLYSIIDASCATMSLMLAAEALGLGTCWVGAFDDDRVSEILGFPSYVQPIGIIPLGHPLERPVAPPRMPLSRIVHDEHW